jgi:hypothetical protein
MLSEQQIREALHANRVVPVAVPNPHGPLGMEQLAEAVARVTAAAPRAPVPEVQRPLTLPLATWEKLDDLAGTATTPGARRFSASDVAAVLLERAIQAT